MADNYKKRMLDKFITSGIDVFDDHNVIELLLIFSSSKADCNETAHRLMNHFGTLAAVFDAPAEELLKIDGVNENGAALLKLIPQITRRYLVSKSDDAVMITSTTKAGKFLLPYFYGETKETFYMLCLDGKGKVLSCRRMFTGDINSASLNIRTIVSTAIYSGAAAVIVAHNHPSGFAIPSSDDVKTTRKIENALKTVDIVLVDHLVIADDDFVSFADNGYLKKSDDR